MHCKLSPTRTNPLYTCIHAPQITPCPYVIYKGEEGEIMRIANTKIDLPSWRASLMALSTTGSKIQEVQVRE